MSERERERMLSLLLCYYVSPFYKICNIFAITDISVDVIDDDDEDDVCGSLNE